jgi:hypothetical protein
MLLCRCGYTRIVRAAVSVVVEEVKLREYIWISVRAKATTAPVLVNVYGGGLVIGDKNSMGSPAGLLASSNDNIIYVTFNYRLGVYV